MARRNSYSEFVVARTVNENTNHRDTCINKCPYFADHKRDNQFEMDNLDMIKRCYFLGGAVSQLSSSGETIICPVLETVSQQTNEEIKGES